MITGAQMRAARALLGIDQRQLAQRSGLSVPTIQRMESSDGVVRGNVDSLMKLVEALLRDQEACALGAEQRARDVRQRDVRGAHIVERPVFRHGHARRAPPSGGTPPTGAAAAAS